MVSSPARLQVLLLRPSFARCSWKQHGGRCIEDQSMIVSAVAPAPVAFTIITLNRSLDSSVSSHFIRRWAKCSFCGRDTVTSEPSGQARRLVHLPEQNRMLQPVRVEGQGSHVYSFARS